MLSNEIWNALVKNAKDNNWDSFIGKSFFHKEWNENVVIMYYTLCGQLFFKNKKDKWDYIMVDDYLKLCK